MSDGGWGDVSGGDVVSVGGGSGTVGVGCGGGEGVVCCGEVFAGGVFVGPGAGDVACPGVDTVSVVLVVVVPTCGAYVRAYFPRVNGFQTGQTFGSGKSATSVPSSAGCMKSRQISAGKLPPVTAIPWTLNIGISPRV